MNSKPLLLLVACASMAGGAMARDTEYHIPFAEVMALPEASQELDSSIKFYFGDQPTPKVLMRIRDDVANKKTNGVGKDDQFGCKWAALSALKSLQQRAKELGANAVINVTSYYRRDTFKSKTEFECHAGAVVIGVTLRGTFVKL